MTEARVTDGQAADATTLVRSGESFSRKTECRATFSNPIARGADPCVVFHDGLYFWCSSEHGRAVAVHRSGSLIERGEKVVVWRAPARGPHRAQLWAPELHWLDGRWYIYVAASSGRNETHRMIVLESAGDEPTSEFRFKSELYTGDSVAENRLNRWAIDGTILDHHGSRHMLWSGWTDQRDEQWLYIARMANPWTIASNRVRICANDDYWWERVDETASTRGLNEGPQVLKRNGRVFVVYSASASWQPSYKLGLLTLAPDGDPMEPGSWTKLSAPVFESTESTWGVGHCGFSRSPDGKEDWIVYHAKVNRRPNWNRVIHAQRFDWSADGFPIFGSPVAAGARIDVPSREPANTAMPVAFGRAALSAAIGVEPMVKEVHVSHVLPEAKGMADESIGS